MHSAKHTSHNLRESRHSRTLLTLLLALTASYVHSQSPSNSQTATISGTVVDTIGAIIPNAILTLESTEKLHLQTTTDNDGHFAMTAPPGEYVLRISAVGFQVLTKESIHLQAGTPTVESIQLAVGSGGCGVCVTDEPPPIEVLNESLDLLLPLSPPLPYTIPARNPKHLHK